MTTMLLNKEFNGVEIYFDNKPIQNIIDSLKNCGFRWHNTKKCWYAKQNKKTIAEAQKYTEQPKEKATKEIKAETKKETIKEAKKDQAVKSLWDRLQLTQGTVDTSKYKYKFVGSNYSGLSVKETAAEIRKILRANFPEVKFSITLDYHKINIEIKSSPYNNLRLEYSPEIERRKYIEYEEEHNKELLSIKAYCQKLLDSYNWDDSDSQSDYFNCHYYDSVSIDYKYIQTEQNETIKADIIDFRNKVEEAAKAEEKRKEKESKEYSKKQEEQHKQYLIRQEEEKKEIELINNSVNITELEENNQYYVIGSQFAHLNKNCRMEQYIEEVKTEEFSLEDVKITKEVHFTNEQALRYFENMLLVDFDFLEQTGGSFTDDNRIQTMTDYNNLTEEERQTVKWNLYGVAIYYNNQLQFVVDAQGFSYARYVGLVDDATIQKELITDQVITAEELQELKAKAETLINYSTEIITELDIVKTWSKENWTEYKEAFKQKLILNNIKLTKEIIQQLPQEMESLKVAMYKLLIEVDGIQEQFKNANMQQGQKYTMFYISDWGSIVTQRITLDKVEYTKYAQYDNAVKITFTPEGKRKLYYNFQHSTILVYNGWLELPVTVLNTVESRNGMTITKSKYGSCDKKQYDEILIHFEEQGIKSIVNTYKPTF